MNQQRGPTSVHDAVYMVITGARAKMLSLHKKMKMAQVPQGHMDQDRKG